MCLDLTHLNTHIIHIPTLDIIERRKVTLRFNAEAIQKAKDLDVNLTIFSNLK